MCQIGRCTLRHSVAAPSNTDDKFASPGTSVTVAVVEAYCGLLSNGLRHAATLCASGTGSSSEQVTHSEEEWKHSLLRQLLEVVDSSEALFGDRAVSALVSDGVARCVVAVAERRTSPSAVSSSSSPQTPTTGDDPGAALSILNALLSRAASLDCSGSSSTAAEQHAHFLPPEPVHR